MINGPRWTTSSLLSFTVVKVRLNPTGKRQRLLRATTLCFSSRDNKLRRNFGKRYEAEESVGRASERADKVAFRQRFEPMKDERGDGRKALNR